MPDLPLPLRPARLRRTGRPPNTPARRAAAAVPLRWVVLAVVVARGVALAWVLPGHGAGRAADVPLLRVVRGRVSQRGQATTEYALVLLGAAAVALLLVAWATRTGAFGSLLDAVLDSIKRKV